MASKTKLPIVEKGDNDRRGRQSIPESGAQGIIVSNHGTRYLDTTSQPLRYCRGLWNKSEATRKFTWTEVSVAVQIYSKGLALGARAVLMGRPLFWGLAGNGEGWSNPSNRNAP
ncbi:MAG: hypothetical protein CM1200mP27_08800 [Chloroflexota bacterium]|nr:MAG: hypothetical protein CM1200mP27_08800 [Chloroflexota bacterium]